MYVLLRFSSYGGPSNREGTGGFRWSFKEEKSVVNEVAVQFRALAKKEEVVVSVLFRSQPTKNNFQGGPS